MVGSFIAIHVLLDPLSGLLSAGLLLYSIVARYEVGPLAWLKPRFWLYNVVMLGQMLLLQWIAYAALTQSLDWPSAIWMHGWGIWALTAQIEVARKCLAPDEETAYRDSYSSRVGSWGSVGIVVALTLLAVWAFVATGYAPQSGLPCGGLGHPPCRRLALRPETHTKRQQTPTTCRRHRLRTQPNRAMVLTECVGNKARRPRPHLRDAGLPWASLLCPCHARGPAGGHQVPDLRDFGRQTSGHPDLYAVRSSSATEDTEEHAAAAGAFLTLLGTPPCPTYLSAACLQVAQSLPSTGSDHGVIVQAFLAQPVASGVLFTHPERYLVNLAPGLCTYVVQGHPVEEIGCHPSGRIYRRQTPQNLSGWTWKDDGLTELQASHSAYTPALAKALQRLYRAHPEILRAPHGH